MKNRLLEYFNNDRYQPQNFEELCESLSLSDDEIIQAKKVLKDFVDEYEIFLSRKNRYILPKDANIYKGVISIKNPDYGFITSPYFSSDLYVHRNGMNGAFDQDVVVFSIVHPYHNYQGEDLKQEAKVIDIIKRSLKIIVGELKEKDGYFYLDVENTQFNRINIIDNDECAVGDIVKAEIVNYSKKPIEAKIKEKVGFKNDIGIDISLIAAKYDFPKEFPKDVLDEVNNINIDIEFESRRRTMPTLENIFTIDGDDAKDLDDAVGIKQLSNGNYLLGVYIADVSYYVTESSKTDLEAFDRGTSVYLINRVIPMLPVRLSNDLCSLNPNTKKLAIGLEMEINEFGEVVESNLFETVIETKYRMTYNNVNKILAGDEELIKKYGLIYEDIMAMARLQEILFKMRVLRGALDFDVAESKIIVDDEGKVKDIELIVRGHSERIIEEFMLIANETVAENIFHLELPFIYRVHDAPSKLKLENFRNVSKGLGYKTLKQKINSKQLQEFLYNLKEEDDYLKTLLLRSMAKAIYSEVNIGHYGLGSTCYTHFTSPIRRYPDLIVHRMIRKYIFNHDINADEFLGLTNKIADIANQASKKERDAIECEYEVNDMKKAEYMANFVGEKFEGIISSVNRFGIFVRLSNTVEGLVHSSKLKGRFLYDAKTMSLVSVNGGVYKLGDKVVVEVEKSDKNKREIDFKIITPPKVDRKNKKKEKNQTLLKKTRRLNNGENKRRRKK